MGAYSVKGAGKLIGLAKTLGNRLIQTLVILLITVALLEIVGLFVFDNRYNWNLRYLSYSSDSLVNQSVNVAGKEQSFWTYAPGTKVRSIAVYADVIGARLEYDCSFDTNSLGFISAGDPSGPVDYLVLGDSYTEGQGGCPWLTTESINADPYLKRLNILNGGLQGASVGTFEAVLRLHEKKLPIKNVAIIAISNDFKRRGPRAWALDTPCYKALECSEKAYWHFENFDVSARELKEKARSRRAGRGVDPVQELLRFSFTARLVDEYLKASGYRSQAATVRQSVKDREASRFALNFSAFERIIERYPEAIVILVPQRDEVGLLGKKNQDSREVEKYLDRSDVSYRWCALDASDFMPIDGHPNRQGYEKLLNCLKQAMVGRSSGATLDSGIDRAARSGALPARAGILPSANQTSDENSDRATGSDRQ